MTQHIPVFYEGQDDLVDILATSIASVCSNTTSFIDFYILDCGLHEINKKLLLGMKEKFHNFSITFLPVDMKQFQGLKGYGAQNFTDPYVRLLIPEIKPDLPRAIYLDTDTIAVRDIKLMWDEDLNGKSIGVVADLGYRGWEKKNFVQYLGGSPDQLFLHAGLFILDCEKWRAQKATEKMLNLAREKKEHLSIIIEELLSLHFKADYQLLDSRYGIMDFDNYTDEIVSDKITPAYLADEWKQAVIIHFGGRSKPWRTSKHAFSDRTMHFFHHFWYYAQMTPFYEGMKMRMTELEHDEKEKKHTYLLFGIPVLTMRSKRKDHSYKLFGIPFLRRKEKKK